MLTWLKILCAVDFSECSRQALELAADLARTPNAELTIVHVACEPTAAALDRLPDEVHEKGVRDLEKKIVSWKMDAEERSGRTVGTLLTRGEPGKLIPRLAESGSFDVVVVGAHGRSGLKDLVRSSVAERVVRSAPCPVVVARPTPWRGELEGPAPCRAVAELRKAAGSTQEVRVEEDLLPV